MNDRDMRLSFGDWLKKYPAHNYLDRTVKRYIRALEKVGEWFHVDLTKNLLEIGDYEEFITATTRIKLLPNFDEINQNHGHGDLSAAMRLYGQFLNELNGDVRDSRRDQLIGVIEREFIGPDPIDWEGMTQSNGEEIVKIDPPHIRYLAGILYPREAKEEAIEARDGEDIPLEEERDDDIPIPDKKHSSGVEYLENAEELINRSNAYRQSAVSLTVAVKRGDEIHVSVEAGIYNTKIAKDPVTEKEYRYWPRKALQWDNNGNALALPDKNSGIVHFSVDINLQFDITYRYRCEDSDIYTFTLENTNVSNGTSVKDDDCFFQTKFCIYSELGFSALTDGQKITKDDDYDSNRLLYRNIHNYAIGHGTAADWEDGDVVKWISTATFPKYDIKPIVPSAIEGVSLKMLKMSPYGNWEESLNELHEMCNKYRIWIKGLCEEKKTLAFEFEQTAVRHISNCETCLSRMEAGVKLLEENETVRTAFQYMNLAMLMQQLHYNLPLQRWSDDGVLEDAVSMPEIENEETWYGEKNRYGKWRPFQLAFVLMNLRSMYYRDCSEREIVDLIWFPTGGGKTEAYLGLSAYTIFIRRLMNKDDKGTAILMRYTLRLLTAQQYERASAMICACDLIRRNHTELFGINRITIGLWVGETTTPNRVKDALKVYDKLYDGDSDNPFVILKCPWCGAQMGPVRKAFVPGYRKYKKSARSLDFSFRCSNDKCDFHLEDLPLYVVDESIYEKTPTLLLGTVDKFAMLPFQPQAQRLFGFENGVKKTSPDLIIQDELHLISGPLGSMVGHYETLIDELCTSRTSTDSEIKPKIIASTATISRAKEQCHALYGCALNNVFQFPPAGLDAGNSFFAKEDTNQNGRRYVGILATGSSSDATTAIRLFSALLYGAKAIKVEKESDRDPYWTNIGYYNSIRELGQAATWIRADIDQQLDVMYKRRYDHKRYKSSEEYRENRRYIRRDEELTSRISGSEVTASLANLGIRYPAIVDEEGKVKSYPIDICLATNMISVGLDVSRLGLMTVAGQPKTTSEYIQATSRVGRNAKDAPGLVFVLYRPGRPRDKSHYEHFKSYHSRVYCNVEPTSVTPFASPVRERALHAIIIGMLRLENNNSYNEDPPKIPEWKLFDQVSKIIEKRVKSIDSDELDATIEQMEHILECWQDWNPKKWKPQSNRDGSYADPLPLMYMAGSQPNAAWGEQGMETPTSMRNVDASCAAELLPNRYTAKES